MVYLFCKVQDTHEHWQRVHDSHEFLEVLACAHEKQFACYLVSQSELQMTHVEHFEYGSGAADTLYVYHFAL